MWLLSLNCIQVCLLAYADCPQRAVIYGVPCVHRHLQPHFPMGHTVQCNRLAQLEKVNNFCVSINGQESIRLKIAVTTSRERNVSSILLTSVVQSIVLRVH